MPARDGATVLVIDDDHEIRDALRALLEAHRYHVLVARDGRDALVVLRTVQIDLVVLDLSMPGMSGWDFLDLHGRETSLALIPVIVATGLRDIGAVPRSVHEVLFKPFSPQALLRAVVSVLGTPRPEHRPPFRNEAR